MGFKDLMSKAQDLANSTGEAADKFLDEFNEALPTMRALGFTIRDFRMSMGIVPEVNAKLVASVSTIDSGKIDDLISRHNEEKLLVTLLKAIKGACHVREQLGVDCVRNIEMDVTLGIPPHIGVAFLGATPAPLAAAA
jgi:hypothetical protein